MPLNIRPDQKEAFLRWKGFDPSVYDIDLESGAIAPKTAPALEEPPPKPAPTPAQPSIAQTAKLVGGRSLVPAASALMATAGGLALVPEPVVSKIGALGMAGLGLGLSYLGGKAGSVAQEAALEAIQGPESYRKGLEELEAARAANPKTALAAEVAPQLLAFKPHGSTLTAARRALLPAARTELAGLDPLEKALLTNAALNAGVGATQEVVQQGLSGEEFQPGRVAVSAALGGVLTQPRGWVTKTPTGVRSVLGFEPLPDVGTYPLTMMDKRQQVVKPQEPKRHEAEQFELPLKPQEPPKKFSNEKQSSGEPWARPEIVEPLNKALAKYGISSVDILNTGNKDLQDQFLSIAAKANLSGVELQNLPEGVWAAYEPGKRAIQLGEKSKVSDAWHELNHAVEEAIANSPELKEKATLTEAAKLLEQPENKATLDYFLGRARNLLGGEEAFQKLSSAQQEAMVRQYAIEEAFTNPVGQRSAHLATAKLRGGVADNLKLFLDDLGAKIKTKLGFGSVDDYVKIMARGLVELPNLATQPGFARTTNFGYRGPVRASDAPIPVETNEDWVRVFHGSPSEIKGNIRTDKKLKTGQSAGYGFYVATKPDVANWYLDKSPTGAIYTGFFNLKNPRLIEGSEHYTLEQLKNKLNLEGQRLLKAWEKNNYYRNGLSGHQFIDELVRNIGLSAPRDYGVPAYVQRSADGSINEITIYDKRLYREGLEKPLQRYSDLPPGGQPVDNYGFDDLSQGRLSQEKAASLFAQMREVVDQPATQQPAGNMINVYHNTLSPQIKSASDLTPQIPRKFDGTPASKYGLIFFSAEKPFVHAKYNPTTIKAAIKLEHPWDFRNENDVSRLADYLAAKGLKGHNRETIEKTLRQGSWSMVEKNAVDWIKDNGYDGIVLREGIDTPLTYAVFDKSQVYSTSSANKPAPQPPATQQNDQPEFRFSNEPQSEVTATPEFKKWFGDSKVVDSQGKPRVVYHGTGGKFNKFKTPAFFTDSTGAAIDYAYEAGGKVLSDFSEPVSDKQKVYPVFLKLSKPATDVDIYRVAKQLGFSDSDMHAWEYISTNSKNKTVDYIQKRVRAALKKEGFDGAIINDTDPYGDDIKAYVTFAPEQIKSAIGNSGAFDATNPDIRYSNEPQVEKPIRKSFFTDAADFFEKGIKPTRSAYNELRAAHGDSKDPGNPGAALADRLETAQHFREQLTGTGITPLQDIISKMPAKEVDDYHKFSQARYEAIITNKLIAARNAKDAADMARDLPAWEKKRQEYFEEGLRQGKDRADAEIYADRMTERTKPNYTTDRKPVEVPYMKLTEGQAALDRAEQDFYKFYADESRKAGIKVKDFNEETGKFEWRDLEPIDFYTAATTQIDSKVMKTLLDKSNSPAVEALRKEFFQYNKRFMPEGALKEAWDSIFQHPMLVGNSHFSAIRKPQEFLLPPSWREASHIRSLERYANAAANDIAFAKYIENDPVMRGIIGIKDPMKGNYSTNITELNGKPFEPIGGSPLVKEVLKPWRREYEEGDLTLDAFNRVAKAGVLGTTTGLKDVVAGPGLEAAHTPATQLFNIFRPLLNLKEYHQRARLQGVSKKHNIAAQELTDPRTTLAERMTDAANLIYKLTGRESLEAISRARSFGTGVLNAQYQLPLALKGNKDAISWMNKFGPKDWKERAVSDTLIDETAANWVRRHQGSYNYEDQPVWTMTGKASPFFAYSKWNIGRLNRFQEDVIAPAFRGDIKPLAKSVLAAYVSGKALESMLVALTGRKQQWPTEEELKLDEARKSDYAYRFAALADLSGFGGMASSLVKAGFDTARKTQPQGFNFQLYDTSANLVKRVSQAAQAMDDGENPIEVLAQLGEQLAKDNIQTYRLYLANFGDTEDKANIERGNRLRDLRVFKQMHDYPTSPLGSYGANPFEGQLERQFKRTSNPEEAANLLQEKLLPRYLAESAENPEMLSRRLKALRRNSDQTFPSPAASPLQFQQYTDFLRRSGGETHMESELDRYLRQAALNRLKSAMVPGGF